MESNRIHRFEFSESNFESEKRRLRELLTWSTKNQIKLYSLFQLPPCVDLAVKVYNQKVTKLSKRINLVLSNISYGRQDLNNYRKKSGNLCTKCLNCVFFAKDNCPGMANVLNSKIKKKKS